MAWTKLTWRKLGGHYHCRLFTSRHLYGTWAKCGDLVFDEHDWEHIRSIFGSLTIIVPEDELKAPAPRGEVLRQTPRTWACTPMSEKVYIFPSQRAAPRQCPSCQKQLDAYTPIGEGAAMAPVPDVGDLTICGSCHTILTFTREGFCISTREEIKALPENIRNVLIVLSYGRSEKQH